MNSEREEDEVTRTVKAQKDEAILVLLGKLALVYWRPDFSPSQAKELYRQYLEDLREFAFADIQEAFVKYRRDPENKFYPTPGQLRGYITTPPSWWVSGTLEHMFNVRHRAQDELQQAVERLSENQTKALT